MNNIITIISFASIISLAGCSGNKSKDDQKSSEKSLAEESTKPIEFIVIQAQSEPDTLKGSLAAVAVGKIGNIEIKISYHSPAVRGRIVWGGLVPYDKVWVTGAHMATCVEFSDDVMIENKTVPAGKYALFTIPGKEEWIVIINKNWQQHLTDKYDAKDDMVRVKVKPEIEESNQERLRYLIESEGEAKGELVIYWEKIEVSLPVKIKL